VRRTRRLLLVRSASFKLAASFLALSVGSAALLLTILYFAVTIWLEERLEARAEAELQELVHVLEAGGRSVLEDELHRRIASRDHTAFAYSFIDRSGAVVGEAMTLAGPGPDWDEALPPGVDDDEAFIAESALVQGGTLVVAVDAEDLHDAHDLFLEQLPFALAFVPLALPGALVVSAFALRRIELMSRATMRIRRGDLAERITLRGSGDEYDRLAANINAMLDAIQDLTQGLRQVSDDIAHDLRSPLTRLRRDLERLTGGGDVPLRVRQAIEAAIAQTDTILATFGALLRIAQIESGTRRAGFAPFAPSDLLRELVEAYEPVAEDAGKRLRLLPAAEITVVGDRQLMVQAAANLLENAIGHTPEGTHIEVGVIADGQHAAIVVADDGPGIPKEEREKVFARLYRLDRSRHTVGAGLGLSLVAAVAKLHRGTVRIEDNAPGVRVVVRLPVEAQPPAAISRREAAAA